MKYRNLIHLMVYMSDNKDLQNIETNSDPLNKSSHLFTRCSTSAKITEYLLSGSIRHNQKMSNLDTILNILNNSTDPSYYIYVVLQSIGQYDDKTIVSNNDSDHVFIIVKVNNDTYHIIQSYIFNYCPIQKQYTHNEITQMLIELNSVFYDNNTPKTGLWTQNDDEIWNKYFHTKLTDRLTGTSIVGKLGSINFDLNKYNPGSYFKSNYSGPIKYNKDIYKKNYTLWQHYYQTIDLQKCFTFINDLINDTEEKCRKCFVETVDFIGELLFIETENKQLTLLKNNLFEQKFLDDRIDIDDIYAHLECNVKYAKKYKYVYDNFFIKLNIDTKEHIFSALKLLIELPSLKQEINAGLTCDGFTCYKNAPSLLQFGGYINNYNKYKLRYLKLKSNINL